MPIQKIDDKFVLVCVTKHEAPATTMHQHSQRLALIVMPGAPVVPSALQGVPFEVYECDVCGYTELYRPKDPDVHAPPRP